MTWCDIAGDGDGAFFIGHLAKVRKIQQRIPQVLLSEPIISVLKSILKSFLK